MKNVGLIAGISGDALTDCLHKHGHQVAMVCGKPAEPGAENADALLVTDLENYAKILAFFENNHVEHVIIGTGHYKAIELAGVLERAGILLNIDYEKSRLAKDKVAFKRELNRLDIKTPAALSFTDVWDMDSIITTIGIPCVVKSSTDRIQPRKANDQQDLRDAIDAVIETRSTVMVEQYIYGNDCTVAVEGTHEGCNSLGVLYYCKAKEYALKGFYDAHSEKMPVDMETSICNIAEQIVMKFGYTGVVRIDFIVADREIYVLELNSVLVTGYNGSAPPFFKAQGIDIADVYVKNALAQFDLKEKN